MTLTVTMRADNRSFVGECQLYVLCSTVTEYLAITLPLFMSALDAEIVEGNPFFYLVFRDPAPLLLRENAPIW